MEFISDSEIALLALYDSNHEPIQCEFKQSSLKTGSSFFNSKNIDIKKASYSARPEIMKIDIYKFTNGMLTRT